MMSRALIEMMQHEIPGNVFDRLPEMLMRYLLGDSVADLLDVAKGELNDDILRPLLAVAHVASDLANQSSELARVHELFGRALIGGIVLVGRGGKRIPFTIPPELRQAWGINWLP